MKKFVICREKTCGIYSIRVNTDCSVVRFEIIKSFDTFEEADDYLAAKLSLPLASIFEQR